MALLASDNHSPESSTDGDLFSTAAPELMLGLTLIPFAVLFVALLLIYWGVEYGVPALNAHSVPPPRPF